MPRSLVSISALLPAPGLADLDGDGKIDLVVGDRATLRQINGKLPGKEAKEALAQWQTGMDKLDDEMDQLAEGASDKEILHKKQVYRKNREKIMKEEYTGFVWIYYQK